MNTLITVDQMIRGVLKTMEETGLTEVYNKATPEEKQAIIDAMNDLFGGRFPKRKKGKAAKGNLRKKHASR